MSCRNENEGVLADNGMVVSARQEASKIGVEILKKGGNAFDAMVATSFALTVVFPNAGNITGANITGTGTTHTLGTIEVAGNVIRSTDSTQIEVNDSLKVVGPLSAGVTTLNPAGSNNIESTTGFTIFGSNILMGQGKSIAFEGATANDFETDIQVTDPTADRTITFPDASGTVALTGSTGYATSTIFTSAVTLILYNSSGTPVKTIVGSAT